MLEISGGTLTMATGTANTLVVGSVANAVGDIKLSSGLLDTTGLSNAAVSFRLGIAAGAYAGVTMTGGNVSSSSWILIGSAANALSVWNQSGGTTFAVSDYMDIAAGAAGSVGVVNFSSNAIYSSVGGIRVGGFGNGFMTVSGNAQVILGGGQGLSLAQQIPPRRLLRRSESQRRHDHHHSSPGAARPTPIFPYSISTAAHFARAVPPPMYS